MNFVINLWLWQVNKRLSQPQANMSFRKGMMVGFLPNWLLEQTAEQTKTSMRPVVASHPASDIVRTRQLNSGTVVWKLGLFYKFCTTALNHLSLLCKVMENFHTLYLVHVVSHGSNGHMALDLNQKQIPCPFGLQYGRIFHQMSLNSVTVFEIYTGKHDWKRTSR